MDAYSYVLSVIINWDIFATRCCILLIFNPNYFRGGEVRLTSKNEIACSSNELHAICFYGL